MKNRIFFLLLLLLSNPINVHALRCDHDLIQPGDRKHDVVEKCGDPVSIDQHYETKALLNYSSLGRRLIGNSISLGQQRYSEIEILVDEWIYDFGSRRFQQLLRFENGVLTDITSLGRRH